MSVTCELCKKKIPSNGIFVPQWSVTVWQHDDTTNVVTLLRHVCEDCYRPIDRAIKRRQK